MITGVGAAVNAAELRPGQDVVVIGAGGVGLNAIQGARIAGARRIVAVDMTGEKLDIAMEFGATHGVLGSRREPWKAACKALGGRGANVVLITVGAIPAYDQAPRYLGRGGKAIMIGMPHWPCTHEGLKNGKTYLFVRTKGSERQDFHESVIVGLIGRFVSRSTLRENIGRTSSCFPLSGWSDMRRSRVFALCCSGMPVKITSDA